MRKPISVQVLWSESHLFKDNEILSFENFETKALRVVNQNMGGYRKTSIMVEFDDGEKYGCRVDLARIDELGFQDHVEKVIKHYELNKNKRDILGTKLLCEFLSQIDFARETNAIAA
jgi:hypothetical protein